MGLSIEEKQEAIELINLGKPLPDKYRFLLFDNNKDPELIWKGKTDEVCDHVFPFKSIEKFQNLELDNLNRTSQWTNKLIHGDNRLILSSLKNGPMREIIESQGGIKLIYIDPPFNVGSDFFADIGIGENVCKKNNTIRNIAYRDTWGKGADSFIAMIYERLILMRDLMAEDGSIYVHCDWRVTQLIRLALDEIFGTRMHLNELIWCYKSGGAGGSSFARKHDTIYRYSFSENAIFNSQKQKSYMAPKSGKNPAQTYYEDEGGSYTIVNVKDWWDDIGMLATSSYERVDYPTQKPEALLERIIKASSNEGDLVADFFCGSGTMAAVAEKLGRKWICTDLGKFAIHTTRKRMIEVNKSIIKSSPFEILKIDINEHPKNHEFDSLVLNAYNAKPIDNLKYVKGRLNDRFVTISPLNSKVDESFLREVSLECSKNNINKVDILGLEFNTCSLIDILSFLKKSGMDILLKRIPDQIFDIRNNGDIIFENVAHIETKVHKCKDLSIVKIELKKFYFFNSNINIHENKRNLSNSNRSGESILIENGQLIKLKKHKNGEIEKMNLTKSWSDWIDYWSIDFEFGKRQVMEKNIFRSQWQSFRSKRDRSIELCSREYKTDDTDKEFSIKVADIFGNDTTFIEKF